MLTRARARARARATVGQKVESVAVLSSARARATVGRTLRAPNAPGRSVGSSGWKAPPRWLSRLSEPDARVEPEDETFDSSLVAVKAHGAARSEVAGMRGG